jgi:molybdenum cofactor cytidylyltransferase
LRGLAADVEAAAVMPGDLPRVRPETVAELVSARRQGVGGIVAPVHGGRRGHPVLIPREAWPDIIALGPDETLRTYLRRHASQVWSVEVDDPGVHADIDTPADYQASDAGRTADDSR